MSQSSSITIKLTQVKCLATSEAGHDEVYIKYSTDGGRENRYPSSGYNSMSPNPPDNVWDTDVIITFKDTAVIELYDNDLGHDESLGLHTYSTTDPQPETVPVSNSNGARYELSTVPVTAAG